MGVYWMMIGASDLGPTVYDGRKLQRAQPAAQVLVVDVPAAPFASVMIAWFTGPHDPNLGTWPGGLYRVGVNVDSMAAHVVGRVALHQVDAAGVETRTIVAGGLLGNWTGDRIRELSPAPFAGDPSYRLRASLFLQDDGTGVGGQVRINVGRFYNSFAEVPWALPSGLKYAPSIRITPPAGPQETHDLSILGTLHEAKVFYDRLATERERLNRSPSELALGYRARAQVGITVVPAPSAAQAEIERVAALLTDPLSVRELSMGNDASGQPLYRVVGTFAESRSYLGGLGLAHYDWTFVGAEVLQAPVEPGLEEVAQW